jgi:hypothetical protein
MKSTLKFALLIAGASTLSFAQSYAQPVTIVSPVGTFSANTTRPGMVYSFSNSALSVHSGVTFGANQSVSVSQNSTRNISAVAQVGRNVSATVSQSGAHNYSALSQFGRNTSALVYQFGQ